MGSGASIDSVPSETLGTEAHEVHEDKDNKPLPFPKQGVVVRYLENFIDEVCGGRDNLVGKTTTDVNLEYVMPMTKSRQASFCSLLESIEHPSFCARAETFISHAWKYYFLDVVDALLNHFCDNLDALIWFDLFSNNQHKAPNLTFEWWCGTFKSAIGEFKHTLMVFHPWSDPIPLTRGWCIFEIYATADTNSRFEIAMSKTDQAQFLRDIEEDVQLHMDIMLSKIDSANSECWFPADRDAIHDVVRRTVGFSRLNAMVFEQLRLWVIRVASKALEEAKKHEVGGENGEEEKNKEAKEKRARLAYTLALLYHGQGKYNEAQPLFEIYVNECSELYGAENEETLRGLQKLARCYELIGDYGAAEEHYLKCFQGMKAIFGETIETFDAMEHLAMLYKKLGRNDEALALYLNIFEKKVNSLGASALGTLVTMDNLGMMYFGLKQLEKAEETLNACLGLKKRDLGDRHPETLTTMNNVALCAAHRGDFTLAVLMFSESLSLSKEILGIDHPNTLYCLHDFGMTLLDKGDKQQAKEVLQESFDRRKTVLGEAHPTTLKSMEYVADLLVEWEEEREAGMQMMEKCLSLKIDSLGKKHRSTTRSQKKMKKKYEEMGLTEKAELIVLDDGPDQVDVFSK